MGTRGTDLFPKIKKINNMGDNKNDKALKTEQGRYDCNYKPFVGLCGCAESKMAV